MREYGVTLNQLMARNPANSLTSREQNSVTRQRRDIERPSEGSTHVSSLVAVQPRRKAQATVVTGY